MAAIALPVCAPFAARWRALFGRPGHCAVLSARSAKVAIVAAHPDDAEFYLGGHRCWQLGDIGADLHLIVATDGDKGYYPLSRPEQTSSDSTAGTARTRRVNGRRSEVIFLGHRDGRLRANETLISQIAMELRRIGPEFVFLVRVALSAAPDASGSSAGGRSGFCGAATEWNRSVGACAILRWPRTHAIDVSENWTRRMALLPFHNSQWHDRRLRFVSRYYHAQCRNGRAGGSAFPYAEGLRCAQMRETVIQ